MARPLTVTAAMLLSVPAAAAAAVVHQSSWRIDAAAAGPVITPGPGWNTPGGAWDSHEVGTMSVVHAHGTFHMYFEACAYNGGRPLRALRIGHAQSLDGIHWTKDAEPVLRNGTPGEWDDEAVWDPFVLYDEKAQLFKLWYRGQASGFINIQWGFATSRDGRSFTKWPGGSISHFDHSRWQKRANDDKVVHDPVTGLWHIYYTFWPSGWGQPDQHLVRVTGTNETNETNFDFSRPERINITGIDPSATAVDPGPGPHVLLTGGA